MARRIYNHGDDRRYLYNGCRCDLCRAANAAKSRQWRRTHAYGQHQPLIDAIGTSRRVQALARDGWPIAYLAQRRGVAAQAVAEVAAAKHPQVQSGIAAQYAALYDELSSLAGPSQRARTWAAKKNWPGSDAWTDDTIDDPAAEPYGHLTVDDVLVQRAIDGNPAAIRALNRPERLEATRRLLARGLRAGGVSARLNVSSQTAAKLVAAAQEEAAA